RVTGDADIVLREQVLPTRPPGELAPPRGEAPGLRPEELGLEAGDLLEVLPAHLPQGRRHVGGHCSSRPPGASRRGGCCWRGATRVDFGTAGSAVSGRRRYSGSTGISSPAAMRVAATSASTPASTSRRSIPWDRCSGKRTGPRPAVGSARTSPGSAAGLSTAGSLTRSNSAAA